MLFWHVAINVGMVAGIPPVVGATLFLIATVARAFRRPWSPSGIVMNVSICCAGY